MNELYKQSFLNSSKECEMFSHHRHVSTFEIKGQFHAVLLFSVGSVCCQVVESIARKECLV